MKWLTPEEAVAAANLSITSEKLIEFTLQSEDEETLEERFQKLGLLFDRDRWKAQKPYLALLSPTKTQKSIVIASSNTTTESNSIDNDKLAEKDEENNRSETTEFSNLQSEHQEEPYIFKKCTVELHLTFKPDDGHPEGRVVIISASSHGDFPINEKIRESFLGELPPLLKELLNELVADFPNRQVRRQIANARNQKKRSTNPNTTSKNTLPTTSATENKNSGTQLTLFGI
ncbi:hypothetical protein [Coleofasciculus sp.]|uniref:hypothetical protein n=1 Tax=Coleofasciculus sp. TaxID=3100458 RepID=UPI0039FB567C